MKHAFTILLLTLAILGSYYSATLGGSLYESINHPGQAIQLSSHLDPERINIFYFYADWCGACRGWSETIQAINRYAPDLRVHCVNIDDWDSPVAQQNGIGFVPNFHIYDGQGRLIARDKAGEYWLRQQVEQRRSRAQAAVHAHR